MMKKGKVEWNMDELQQLIVEQQLVLRSSSVIPMLTIWRGVLHPRSLRGALWPDFARNLIQPVGDSKQNQRNPDLYHVGPCRYVSTGDDENPQLPRTPCFNIAKSNLTN